MNDPISPLSPSDRFTFSCNRRLPCFNECCRDLNQYLTPYDILKARQLLGMTSSAFLFQYTRSHTGQSTGLPVITLKTSPGSGFQCPFVQHDGCMIYESRPTSCRLYPLARALSRSRETGKLTERYFLIQEPHCKGFSSGRSWTVDEWLDDQDARIFNEMNDKMMDIIHLKNSSLSGALDAKSAHLFHMACYDLDTFRHHIFEKGLLGSSRPPLSLMEQIRTDDAILLKFSMDWIRKTLFQNVTSEG